MLDTHYRDACPTNSPIAGAVIGDGGGSGQHNSGTHRERASPAPIPASNDGGAEGHTCIGTHATSALGVEIPGNGEGDEASLSLTPELHAPRPHTIAAIVSLHREHRSLQRAVGDMDRRIKSEQRHASAARHLRDGLAPPKGKFPPVNDEDEAFVERTRPRFFAARGALEAERRACQRDLLAQVKPLPVMAWATTVRGLGVPSVAAIIGEAGDLSAYANPAKLWKRMGLAVIDGGAQRRIADAEAALRHGYNPRRRSEMHVIGDCLVRARGALADIYRERKAYELTKGIKLIHAHKRALRYIEKRLLREMWRAWNSAA